MKYDVTIAIPVYNAEKYLQKTLLSALAQDYSSIEFLILDDCGTDNSIAIIKQLQQEHPRGDDIRIVSQPRNMGVGAARNRIIDEAQGEFLFFLDADDLIVPTTITLLIAAARKHDAQWVRASHERVKMIGNQEERLPIIYSEQVFTTNADYATYALNDYGHLDTSIWNILICLDLIRRYHLRFVETNFWEDMAFTYQLVTYVERAALLPDITYYYYCRENTLSNFQERKIVSKEEVLRNVATVNSVKSSCLRLLDKPYLSTWLCTVLTTDFYIVSNVIKNRNRIQPAVSDAELRGIMHSPLSLAQTLRLGDMQLLVFKLLSMLFPFLSVLFLKSLSRLKTS